MKRFATTVAVSVAGAVALAAPAAAATNDTYYGKQYGPQQVRAPQAWATSTGANQRIAIVDSGVDLDHPDLSSKIAGGATFACADGQSSPCGNGDWESGRNDDEGNGEPHGTHVAGIAAAITNNSTGIAGVAPDAQILAVKALGGDGSGSFEDIAAGIRWSVDNGADVINLSLGALPGVQAFVITGIIDDVQQAIAYARSKGVVVVAAAGNESSPLCDTPGFDRGALCVTATDRNEAKAWYSNLGVNQQIDAVAAPGGQGLLSCSEDIISTVPSSAEGFCTRRVGTPGYDFYAGTSMATPHVAGVAALLTAQGRTDDETVDVLKATARKPVTGTRGVFDPVYGFGIVDAAAAVAAPGATTTTTTGPAKGGGKDKTKPRGAGRNAKR
jgi:subtilisin family serine protease